MRMHGIKLTKGVRAPHLPTPARLCPCPAPPLLWRWHPRIAGAGVSSSASIVCSSALAVMTAHGLALSQQVAPTRIMHRPRPPAVPRSPCPAAAQGPGPPKSASPHSLSLPTRCSCAAHAAGGCHSRSPAPPPPPACPLGGCSVQEVSEFTAKAERYVGVTSGAARRRRCSPPCLFNACAPHRLAALLASFAPQLAGRPAARGFACHAVRLPATACHCLSSQAAWTRPSASWACRASPSWWSSTR